jgi:uncharacterized protein (TIGR02145 family)
MTKTIHKMLKALPLLLTLNISLLTCFAVFSQSGAAINTTGSAADASAILDVSSTNAGMLIPRMTKTQRNAIGSPAEGLLIYQTDDTVGFWYRSTGVWKLMGSGAGSSIANGSAAGNTLYWDGSQWIESSNIYNDGGSVGIGTNNPDASASLELGGVSKGLLINRMTTAERDLIPSPIANGLMIYNLDCNNFDYYNGTSWVAVNPIVASISISANPGGAVCDGTSVTFTATPVNGGAAPSYQWKLNGGDVGTNSATYTNSSLNNGDQISCELTSNAACVSGNPALSNVLTMIVAQPPTVADAGTDQSLCNVTTTTLSANSPTVGTGSWSVVSGSATITNPSSPTSNVTDLVTGTATLQWTISNSPCTASTDVVDITVVEPPTVANAGTDINPACDVTTATLAANTPTVGIGSWSVVSGSATITTPSSPTSGVTGLAISGTATLRWTISNSPCAASTDDVVITTVICCPVLTDSRDSKIYQTVPIGAQCWMKENLNYASANSWCYGNNSSNCNIYGRLYTWDAASGGTTSSANPSGVQGVCPTGWHLPSDAEWQQLEIYLGMDPSVANTTDWRGTDQGSQLKESGTSHWSSGNTGTNSSGFTALPGGGRLTSGSFDGLGLYGSWWSATEVGSNAWYRYLYYDLAAVGRRTSDKGSGYAVRCLRD